MTITEAQLRRYAVARSLFRPTTLGRAIARLGFVQADPIRAPARAQDLVLRHRVKDYRAGDLERRYPQLVLEEDFFVNYGFLPRAHSALMHPRVPRHPWEAAKCKQAEAVLAFVHERGAAHPREVDAHFAHGKVTNWFGGSTNASTQLLDEMHYRGLLRVVRRDGGTRVYAARDMDASRQHAADADATVADLDTASAKMDALVDLVVQLYAPLQAAGLGQLLSRMRFGAPQWASQRG
ncbi:MAG TPA: crosslink repair DNA glycosylase YcaQ family protein, partial [Xanthomonadaceae bacterium]|nr:crosslink repair DNA glycosylase YcaQ family protein [Xanthomonadaceae bacterium]